MHNLTNCIYLVIIIKIQLEASEHMNNNFLYFRNKANIPKKTLAKLLHTSVYTYCGYENNRLNIPKDVLIMFSRIFQIPMEEIFLDQSVISEETNKNLEHLSELRADEQEHELISRLVGTQKYSISFREIASIRKNIYINLKSDGAMQ